MRHEFTKTRAGPTIPETSTGTGHEQNLTAHSDNEADESDNESHATEDEEAEQRHDDQGYEQFVDATDLDSSMENITPATEADEGAVVAERALALRKKMKKEAKKAKRLVREAKEAASELLKVVYMSGIKISAPKCLDFKFSS